jgi:hypothetical protein
MKKLLLLVFLASGGLAMADQNVLKNGDFSGGINHWEGDCRTINGTTFDSSTLNAPTTGVIVKLRGSDWTKVTQDFDGKMGKYLLTVTYTVSPDLKFSPRPDNYLGVPALLGLARLMPFDANVGQWAMVVTDLGADRYSYWKITPKIDPSATQSIKCNVHIDSDATSSKTFCLGFPPGKGYMTLQSISLVPADANNP